MNWSQRFVSYGLPVLCLVLTGCQAPPAAASGRVDEPHRPALQSWFGSSPQIDGLFSPNEWSDATEIYGVRNWTAEFLPVTDDADLSLRGWVKHDRQWLYFAFDITD